MRPVLAALALLAASGCTATRPAGVAFPDWPQAFASEGGRGVFVLYEPGANRTRTSDAARAAERFLPASTFKLYNALVALDARVVTDVDSAFTWDRVERSIPAWNRDHTLRSGMAASTVWLYQRVATDVGYSRYAGALVREPYGDGVMGDSLEAFWLDNSLRISALEQVAFVDRLRTGTTAFSDAAEAAVRGIVPVLAERAGAHGPVRLLAKTGWGGFDRAAGGASERVQLGWLVGWVERAEADGGPVVFALNVEPDPSTGRTLDMAPARLRIATAILEAEGILPPAD